MPVAAGFGLALLALAMSIVLWGLYYGYSATLGTVIRSFAGLIGNAPLIGGFISGKFEDVDNLILQSISRAAIELDKSAHKFWAASEWLVKLISDALVDFAGDTFRGMRLMHHVTIPRAVHHAVAPLRRGIDDLAQSTAASARGEAALRSRGIDALTKDLTADKQRGQHGIDALEAKVQATLADTVSTLNAEIADVWGYTRRTLSRRLSRVERLVLSGAITVAAVRALDLRFPWWKCTNVRRFNRTLCRMPTDTLATLLGAAAVTAIMVDPREVAHAAQTATGLLETIVRDLADI